MSIQDLMTQTLVLVRTGTSVRDGIGGTSPGTEERVEVRGYLEPMTGQGDVREDRTNRNTQIGDWLAVVPAGTDVIGWDRVEAQGRTFDIIGPPAPFRDPLTNTEHHIEILLQEVGI